jgi:DNA replication regulator SLD2
MTSRRILTSVHPPNSPELEEQMLTIVLAGKYKEYNKIRDLLSGSLPPPVPASKGQTPRKRKHEYTERHSISKRQQIAKTPSKPSMQPWEVDPYESPSVIRNLFTPSRKTALGPTPQKDGQVLGLFDLLEETKTGDSPLKVENEGKGLKASVLATPSKGNADQLINLKHGRTPASAGKRFMLDAFATPLKDRDISTQGGKTPSTVSKLHFSTPSFLRRDSHRIKLPVLTENEDGVVLSPEMVRVPRKPLVRGLSSMLAGLRKMEDDAADEDLEALHEMEMEIESGSNPAPQLKLRIPLVVLVEDDQRSFPLGGFDDEAQFDSEPEESKNPALGREGQPLKAYKKKGQKRTTRRINMKPTRSKPQAQQEALPEGSDNELAGPDKTVPKTQADEMTAFADARNFDSDSQSEYTASEGGTRYRRPDQSKKNKDANKNGKIKTAARKVSAMAHQNFKRLKLRSSGAKGGPSHNSRFRRRK